MNAFTHRPISNAVPNTVLSAHARLKPRHYRPLAWAMAGSVGLHVAAFASVQNIDLTTTHRTDVSALASDAALNIVDWAAPVLPVAGKMPNVAVVQPAPLAAALRQRAQVLAATQHTLSIPNTLDTPNTLNSLNTPNALANWAQAPAASLVTQGDSSVSGPAPSAQLAAANTSDAPLNEVQFIAAVSDKALADVTASKPGTAAAPAASAAPAFNPAQGLSLPKNMVAKLKGSGNYKKIKGNGDGSFQFKYTEANGVKKYTAQMDIAVSLAFLSYHSSFKSEGVFDAQGVHPLRSEEKSSNKSMVAITAEPEQNRVSISNQTGFQPYHPKGQDLLSTIVQLGLLVQSQPQWAKAGTAQDFTVYRPGGIKSWHFQSQGVQTVMVNGVATPTVYVKRVSLDADSDYEDQQHLWLDPARHGLPVRIQIVKKDGQVDLTMTQWEE
jgi:Protein of unknown function (DUF3108)